MAAGSLARTFVYPPPTTPPLERGGVSELPNTQRQGPRGRHEILVSFMLHLTFAGGKNRPRNILSINGKYFKRGGSVRLNFGILFKNSTNMSANSE